MENKLYLERLNNTQIVDLKINEYLQASLDSDNEYLKGWDYLKTNLTKELKEVLLNKDYNNLTYNSDNIRFILNSLNTFQVTKITEELKKQLGSFVYVWKDIKRDLNKKEQEQELKEQLTKEGFIEINNTQKELDNKKVECVLDVNAIGMLGSFDKKAKIKGKLFWSESYKALMLIPKRCRTRGHIIKDKCYIKELI